jgi:hypothetical protein
MSRLRRVAKHAPYLVLLLAGCARDAAPPELGVRRPASAEEARYRCRMQGAAAEDAYSWPRRSLSIDGALVRAQETESCLETYRRNGVIPR